VSGQQEAVGDGFKQKDTGVNGPIYSNKNTRNVSQERNK